MHIANTLKFTIMKKVFTLLFAVGLASSVFAQGGRNAQYPNQSGNTQNQSSNYSKDNTHQYQNTNQGNNGYNSNGQQYNQYNGNSIQRGYGERNDGRDFRNDYPVYNRDRNFGRDKWVAYERYDRRHAEFNRRFERHDRW
jgi:hypothetical protein